MAVTITGNNTPTAGGVTYGDGSTYATTTAGTSGQALLSGGAGSPTWGTPATATNLAGGSNGTIPYQSGSGTTQMLAAGTSGQVLTSAGASAPTWTTPSAGAMTLISTVTASSTANAIFTGLTTAYSCYVVQFNRVVPATNNAVPQLTISNDNGATYFSTGYEDEFLVLYNSSYNNNRSYGNAQFNWPSVGNTATLGGFSATLTIPGPSVANTFGYYYSGFWYNESVYGYTPIFGGGSRGGGSSGVNAIKFAFNTGNIASGNIKLYGIS